MAQILPLSASFVRAHCIYPAAFGRGGPCINTNHSRPFQLFQSSVLALELGTTFYYLDHLFWQLRFNTGLGNFCNLDCNIQTLSVQLGVISPQTAPLVAGCI